MLHNLINNKDISENGDDFNNDSTNSSEKKLYTASPTRLALYQTRAQKTPLVK
jgi:hypothetical protein